MDSTNSYIKQLYTSRKTIISYLKNSNYDCSEYENFCYEEINIMKDTDNLSFIVENELGVKCYIKYEIDITFKHNVLKKNSILSLKSKIFDGDEPILSKNDTLFIITTNYSEDSVHAMIKNSWETEGIFIVLFNLAHLQINILQHSYVPKHETLTVEQTEEFYKKYNVNESQIPEISRFDPVARALCLRPKQICKITRYDKISYKNEYYRICVS
jgi:DNA-directed RNA polymerase subunit H (RpoH/RPB5)